MLKPRPELVVDVSTEVEVLEDLEEDDEVRVEHLVEAEEQLRDELLESERGHDVTVDLRGAVTGGMTAFKVVGGERDGDEFIFRIRVDGEIEEVPVQWPDDPTDPDEPLVRLARLNGTTIDRIADIDELPAIRVDDDWVVVARRITVTGNAKIVLPDGHATSITYPSPNRTITYLLSRVALALISTQLVSIHSKSDGYTASLNNWRIVALAAAISTGLALIPGSSIGFVGAFVASLIAIPFTVLISHHNDIDAFEMER